MSLMSRIFYVTRLKASGPECDFFDGTVPSQQQACLYETSDYSCFCLQVTSYRILKLSSNVNGQQE